MFIGTNFPIRSEYSDEVRRQITNGLDPFAAIAEAGLDYVELSQRHEVIDKAALCRDVEALHAHGLQVNFHPYYHCRDFGTNREVPQLRPNVNAVLEAAQQAAQQECRQVTVNFHAASGSGDRQALLQHSFAFHTWLMESVHKLDSSIRITTEHQLPPDPQQAYHRIGDRYTDLLLLQAECPDPLFGICWDMGHSTMRHAFYGDPLHPPADFAPLVRHVHIHDVELREPKDHCLIGTGEAPLSEFVAALLAVNYEGGFTMEYHANEFFKADYTDFLRHSKAALVELVTANV